MPAPSPSTAYRQWNCSERNSKDHDSKINQLLWDLDFHLLLLEISYNFLIQIKFLRAEYCFCF